MLKRIAWLVATIGLCLITAYDVRPQTSERKFEVGGQFSLLRLISRTGSVSVLPCLGPLPCPTVTVVTTGTWPPIRRLARVRSLFSETVYGRLLIFLSP